MPRSLKLKHLLSPEVSRTMASSMRCQMNIVSVNTVININFSRLPLVQGHPTEYVCRSGNSFEATSKGDCHSRGIRNSALESANNRYFNVSERLRRQLVETICMSIPGSFSKAFRYTLNDRTIDWLTRGESSLLLGQAERMDLCQTWTKS